ncbi:protein of unknown function [Rhodovastum atsumiense]|nr:protein of unknown function [Rhodovastum atsumiense]
MQKGPAPAGPIHERFRDEDRDGGIPARSGARVCPRIIMNSQSDFDHLWKNSATARGVRRQHDFSVSHYYFRLF